jgi:hypothetical protein
VVTVGTVVVGTVVTGGGCVEVETVVTTDTVVTAKNW